MNIFKITFKFIFLVLLISALTCIQNGYTQSSDISMRDLINKNMILAKKQYLLMTGKLPSGRMPRSFDSKGDSLITSNTKWWCSGFYPGSLWYIYEYTKDDKVKTAAENSLIILEPEKHYTGNHDLGFMMYCSFGNAYRISGNQHYKPIIDTAAFSLTTRYRPSIKSIQSWNKNQYFNCPVIIDNMMNLELLMWVAQTNNNKMLEDVALNHANSTLKNHFRADNSSFHVLDYDLETGEVIGKKTWQGHHDSSAWARGQAWGLYGFTMMYRFTKIPDYLQKAKDIARFMLDHPNMPADYIPYWDYNEPSIPNTYRDASTASILASALLELGTFCNQQEKMRYAEVARVIIKKLSTPEYLSKPGTNGGFLLKHGVGGIPQKSEIDVPLTYADYYFLEAMIRYKNWYLN